MGGVCRGRAGRVQSTSLPQRRVVERVGCSNRWVHASNAPSVQGPRSCCIEAGDGLDPRENRRNLERPGRRTEVRGKASSRPWSKRSAEAAKPSRRPSERLPKAAYINPIDRTRPPGSQQGTGATREGQDANHKTGFLGRRIEAREHPASRAPCITY